MCFFALSVYFASLIFAKSALEEVIDDELVWQEVKNLPVDAALIAKMIAEIEGIKRRSRQGIYCVQYVLYASVSGYYPCFDNVIQNIYLKQGEIWKIGKTCMPTEKRYSPDYPDERLLLKREFEGTAEQCLIVEKVKIYAYFYSKENQRREIPLTLPPGNKIYR